MAPSPVKFFFLLLASCVFGWVVFIFSARLLAWILSRIMGASVGFRVAGCNCLRDVNVKFRKGAVDSLSIGEIKLSFRKSLVKLGVGFFSRDPKLQLLVCDFEVVMRALESNTKNAEPNKPRRSQSARSKGKWMVVANMSRFISISITDLIVKVSTASIEVKDLKMDISKAGGSTPILFVKLNLQPILLHMAESRLSCDQSLMSGQENFLPSGPAILTSFERNSVPFVCERLSVLSELVHARGVGVVMTNMDIQSGEVIANLNDTLFYKNKANEEQTSAADHVVVKKSMKKPKSTESLNKIVALFPEKVSFNLPKLDVRFVHHGHGLYVENNVMGIHLKSSKSNLSEDSGETISHFDIQMDFSEIHLLRENDRSVLEILKLAIVSSVDVPLQLMVPIRAEVDIKLGGTQFNIIMSKLKPWMQVIMSKKKRMVLREDNSIHEQPQVLEQSKTDTKAFMWTCTLSAPEMSVVLYGLTGSPLYHCCSQSSHLFANNIATKGIAVHGELGELHLHMADEYQECLQESLFGIETNSGPLVHIARVSMDWGYKEMEFAEVENDINRWKLVFAIDITGMGMYLSFQRVESIMDAFLSIKTLFKSLGPSKKRTVQQRGGHLSKSHKGVLIWQLNLERCSVNFFGDVVVENSVVMDPKKVNYGTHGGQNVISMSADGTPRRAYITSTLGDSSIRLNCSILLEIFHFSACINRDKQSTQMEIERTQCVYQECFETCKSDTKVTLFDMQNAKFVRRSSGNSENTICSLFSSTDIGVRWEPDVHLSMFELFIRLKYLWLRHKSQEGCSHTKVEVMEPETEISPVRSGKHRRKDSVFAVDVEMLRVSAELADGVEIMVLVESIFSENARIGVLLEGLKLSFNDARIFQSSRMQISRVPCASIPNSSLDTKTPAVMSWDWVIRGLDVHICMPYRLQLRAIDDAIEDTLRAMKLICAAKSSLIYPSRKESSTKLKSKSINVGCVRFNIRKLTADIEEEPLQGWLDEHYHLMKKEQCELDVRLKFLDDIISDATKVSAISELNEGPSEKKIYYNGTEIDVNDNSAIRKLQEELHKQAFRFYYKACMQLVSSNGSGSCKDGFQAGFKLSTSRTSLLLVTATEVDLKLTNIEDGDSGMIEFIKKHDPVCAENKVPFSRLYGQNISLNAMSLTVQLRDYSFPVFSAISGKCDGCVVLAQQATFFQPQIQQDVFVGKRQKVRMWRSASGTTPALKTYSNLPLSFEKAEISFGVGYEPVLADISYAFTVALRRANLGTRGGPDALTALNQAKKEKNLPWWDDMRYYIHGKNSLSMKESKWYLLATTDPYEKCDMVQFHSGYMNIQQADGRVFLSAKDFKIFVSSMENLMKNCTLKLPVSPSEPFIETPAFCIEVDMDWECDSGNPLDHYLHAFPLEGRPREKVLDPFRSTSLSLRFNFSLRPPLPHGIEAPGNGIIDGAVVCHSGDKSEQMEDCCPTMRFGAHDLAWVFKWWSMYYIPPHKLRSFSRWPRYGVPRVARSGNLSLDKVMTELMLRVDSMPACIVHMPFEKDDPARGLTFKTTKLKYELCYSRGKQKYTFDCKRDPLDLVYQGLDLHMLKSHLRKEKNSLVDHHGREVKNGSHAPGAERVSSEKCTLGIGNSDGFLLSSEYFTIRKQAPKADPSRLMAWQDAGRRNLEMTYVRSEFENGSESDHTRSDMSDDDGFNVVIADNCQRVFVYGLKLLWTLRNRDAVWAWVGGISKAFEPSKPSPSRQYAQRKLAEGQKLDVPEIHQEETSKPSSAFFHGAGAVSPQHGDSLETHPSPSASYKMDLSSGLNVKHPALDDPEEDGTRHFMVNVIQPQFNLHSEDANGRFLLAAASGRVLARSFHSVLHVGYEMIEQALGTEGVHIRESQPEMAWKRVELSVMLEEVQAHVAPTDVDPGAGVQWLPKILRRSPKVKRTGALLERVFLPCTMYFRYTRHKGGTPELKVKPLKELSFNSPNITATMTSRQFQVMVDVLTNLLFARLPKPRKSSLSYASDDDEDVSEEADEVVPDGVEEVELARISLEQAERERKLLLDDIRTLSSSGSSPGQLNLLPDTPGELWMISHGKSTLVQELRKELANKKRWRKAASVLLRAALQRAAHLRLMEKEKNKSPSCAMRISLRINKVMWCMLADGKPFAEATINDMIYDFDRDYKDIGMAQFTTKYFVVRNCLPNTKCDMLLSAWNPPPEWGKNDMLRVDAKQGAPREGGSPLELFMVEIYPLKIHLTEIAYRMMWHYFFPEEEQDSLRRQELWKVSTTAGVRAGFRRMKKSTASETASTSNNRSGKDTDSLHMPFGLASASAIAIQSSSVADSSQGSKFQNLKANMVCGSNSELRRTSSFDRTWEETVAESVANELVLSTMSSTRSGPLNSASENQLVVNEETSKGKAKESKLVRSGRSSNGEKKVVKSQEEKRSRARKLMVFHDIKISQVELLVTYEGSRFAVSELKLLMDTFHRVEFTGTWTKLFSRVKKHIIWSVLKSVTGMQGKKFKDKSHSRREIGPSVPDSDLNFSDSDGGQAGKDQFPISWPKRPSDGAGEGFVTSIRGLFNSQRRRAKAFVLRTMRGEADNEFHGEWSESDVEFSPFARQLTITKAKRLIRRHTKKFRSRGQKGVATQQRDSLRTSPRDTSPYQSDSSKGSSSSYEDFHD